MKRMILKQWESARLEVLWQSPFMKILVLLMDLPGDAKETEPCCGTEAWGACTAVNLILS